MAVLFNLAQAITGDRSWIANQPWPAVRVVVGVLFALLVLARLILWILARADRRQSRKR